ncbi:hypothetical protein ACQPYE_13740 [Actinosynnema sp. CA-299493]
MEVPEPAPDAGRGEPGGFGGAFPGVAQVGDQWAGQAELGAGGQDRPGQRSAASGSRSRGLAASMINRMHVTDRDLEDKLTPGARSGLNE